MKSSLQRCQSSNHSWQGNSMLFKRSPRTVHQYKFYWHAVPGKLCASQIQVGLACTHYHKKCYWYFSGQDICVIYLSHVYTMYVLIQDVIYQVYTRRPCIYMVYTMLQYTRYIPSTSNQKAWRRWKTSSLGLRSLWILVCAVIGWNSTS